MLFTLSKRGTSEEEINITLGKTSKANLSFLKTVISEITNHYDGKPRYDTTRPQVLHASEAETEN